MAEYPVIDKPEPAGIEMGAIYQPGAPAMNTNQRDEVEHARIVKERIESLNSEVVNDDYKEKVDQFKNNRTFLAFENTAHFCCNFIVIAFIVALIVLLLIIMVGSLFTGGRGRGRQSMEADQGSLWLLIIIFGIIYTVLKSAIFVVQPMEAYVYSSFHKIRGVTKKQGCHCRPLCFEERQSITLKVQTFIVESSIPDASGSPMQVKAMVNFVVDDPVAALYYVENMHNFVRTQAFDVVLRICGKFRYKSPDPTEVTLLEDGHHISVYMRELLQKKTNIAGVEIMRVDFIDISYSTEMTMSLLQVQKAEARLDARAQVVEGAVSITSDALDRLRDSEMIDLEQQDYEELASSLMALTCSDDGNVQAVMRIA